MIHNRSLLAMDLSRTIIIITWVCSSVQTYFTAFRFFKAKRRVERHTTSIILIFLLHFNMFYAIKEVSVNVRNGKIASFRSAERGGHRLKAALECVAWFAREQLWRHRRPPAVIGAECPRAARECGWYRGRVAFRPSFVGGKAFLLPFSNYKLHLKG